MCSILTYIYLLIDPNTKEYVNYSPKSIPIVRIKENEIIVYPSISQAAKCGFGNKEIKLCCDGKYKQHKGYTWRYKNES